MYQRHKRQLLTNDSASGKDIGVIDAPFDRWTRASTNVRSRSEVGSVRRRDWEAPFMMLSNGLSRDAWRTHLLQKPVQKFYELHQICTSQIDNAKIKGIQE
jgi:hypothetical protein